MACAPGSGGTDVGGRPNVLLITVDTLRADHLGPYGYARRTAPALDGLAESGIVFDSAQASSSWTLPTLASVVTGHFSSTHRCWKRRSRLSPAFETLPEILRDAGYDTACAISHIFLARSYGLQQGFVHFDTSYDRPVGHGDKEISSPRVTARGIDFLERKAASPERSPWLLWLHYFDPHFVYLDHGRDAESFGDGEPVDLYDGEIHFTDRHVGEVLSTLEATGFADSTIVAFFADHGEEFGDHGGLYHGHTLHGELVRVPFVLRAPGFEPRHVAHTVRMVDLMPTVLELVGLPAPADIAGRSLVPSMRGEAQDLPALSELRLLGDRADFESLVQGDWTLIHGRVDGSLRLYDLARDPGEEVDLSAEEPERVAAMSAELERLVREAEEAGELYGEALELDLSVGEQVQLGELGYAGDDEDEETDPDTGAASSGGGQR